MRRRLDPSRQFALFVTGGLLCALVDIGLMQLLLYLGVHYASAASAGFLAGLMINYAFHSGVTFRVAATPARFMRYTCVVGINYLLTLACVALAATLAGQPLAGKIVSLPLVALNGYLLGRHWIFK
jgi:putative flippase GtrA